MTEGSKLGRFESRHIGPQSSDQGSMLRALGFSSLDEFTNAAVPRNILSRPTFSWNALSETDATNKLKDHASQNRPLTNFYGQGYYGTITPAVIQRCVLENPSWYTQYTPYQPEISQGRLECLLNFQTLTCELTGLDVSNASLLDEGTAAAEAMAIAYSQRKDASSHVYLVHKDVYSQTQSVVKARARALGIEVSIVSSFDGASTDGKVFGGLVQYVGQSGELYNLGNFRKNLGSNQLLTVAGDPLALVLLEEPSKLGADFVVGCFQRFGIPLGFGGPHAGYLAAKSEFSRKLPGRIVGVSKDRAGKIAYRLSLQTREQHIRREKATSNICTAQALLANMSALYAMYHGPEGLKKIAMDIHSKATLLRKKLTDFGFKPKNLNWFDTTTFEVPENSQITIKSLTEQCLAAGILISSCENSKTIRLSVDETTHPVDLAKLVQCITSTQTDKLSSLNDYFSAYSAQHSNIDKDFLRKSQPVKSAIFSKHHSETSMMRYIHGLSEKDLSLTHSMIPLGSCTMKLNAASELAPLSWPSFAQIHPFGPESDTVGYRKMIDELESMLCEVTGFSAFSFQPNSGAQGEYAALLAIRRYLESISQPHRDICLIPTSAHGTNPASAVMAGFKVVLVECEASGDISLRHLKEQLAKHSASVATMMVTYPSTHGVFEEGAKEICDLVHSAGGVVYMDGANMNAQVGLTVPAEIGFDVCHLNLHKTFCIPHGGGGPGVGPIGVKKFLAPFLPGHPQFTKPNDSYGPVSSAPFGSASLLVIPWMYMKMMGGKGLRTATEVAILNANYIANRLSKEYSILYKSKNGLVAHECIVDLRPFQKTAGIQVVDVAKRLMDYGFHSPTMAWPVPGTLMIEPTESEPLQELDRFVEAMLSIREEIRAVENGTLPKDNNPLHNAPHTQADIVAEDWNRPYSREKAVFPLPWVRDRKFWPTVGRIDEAFGDRNFFCTCPEVESYK